MIASAKTTCMTRWLPDLLLRRCQGGWTNGSVTGTGRAEPHVPAGCHAECRLECPGEMRLVGEACLERRFCQGPRVAQPTSGHVEAPHHRISVWGGPVDDV